MSEPKKKSSKLALLAKLCINLICFSGFVFIVLKFANVIDWSWWLVLSPYIFMLTCGILFLVGIIGVIVFAPKKKEAVEASPEI